MIVQLSLSSIFLALDGSINASLQVVRKCFEVFFGSEKCFVTKLFLDIFVDYCMGKMAHPAIR